MSAAVVDQWGRQDVEKPLLLSRRPGNLLLSISGSEGTVCCQSLVVQGQSCLHVGPKQPEAEPGIASTFSQGARELICSDLVHRFSLIEGLEAHP